MKLRLKTVEDYDLHKNVEEHTPGVKGMLSDLVPDRLREHRDNQFLLLQRRNEVWVNSSDLLTSQSVHCVERINIVGARQGNPEELLDILWFAHNRD